MLIVRIDVKRDKKIYQEVLDKLAAYDIVSAAWEEPTAPKIRSGATGADLGSNLSQAIDSIRDSQRDT